MKKYDPDYKVKTREEAKKIFEETLFLPRTDHLKSLDYVYTENEKFDKNRFMSKINSHPHVLTKQGDAEGYVDAILKVYNHHSKKKNVLRLRDLND